MSGQNQYREHVKKHETPWSVIIIHHNSDSFIQYLQ